jgi:hypothetical protein
MKWIGFLVFLALVVGICWYFGLFTEVAKPFKAWMRWIGISA